MKKSGRRGSEELAESRFDELRVVSDYGTRVLVARGKDSRAGAGKSGDDNGSEGAIAIGPSLG